MIISNQYDKDFTWGLFERIQGRYPSGYNQALRDINRSGFRGKYKRDPQLSSLAQNKEFQLFEEKLGTTTFLFQNTVTLERPCEAYHRSELRETKAELSEINFQLLFEDFIIELAPDITAKVLKGLSSSLIEEHTYTVISDGAYAENTLRYVQTTNLFSMLSDMSLLKDDMSNVPSWEHSTI